MVGTPGPTPLRLVAVQQGRVLADEEVADMPANASAIGGRVLADEKVAKVLATVLAIGKGAPG
eukprot:scaffold71464_cov14-Tisochrysis_lutea.AAC.2